ncbi:unnamed protein product [Nippostrongylus brasiliensis]|uniref:Secreted protein n=1 Tax=Nippostrongylus brasiliensis TaxID=27835 RepID=A0A0N4Y3S7_NIPBR|nr:unnamed protein product [Nippostrongylus brasiliensis]
MGSRRPLSAESVPFSRVNDVTSLPVVVVVGAAYTPFTGTGGGDKDYRLIETDSAPPTSSPGQRPESTWPRCPLNQCGF